MVEVSKATQWVFAVLIAIAFLPFVIVTLVFTVIFVMFIVKLMVDYWFVFLPLAAVWHLVQWLRRKQQ